MSINMVSTVKVGRVTDERSVSYEVTLWIEQTRPAGTTRGIVDVLAISDTPEGALLGAQRKAYEAIENKDLSDDARSAAAMAVHNARFPEAR